MQALCASPTSSSPDTFVASAGLAVQFAGAQERMPLLRIDRHGFTVSVTDDAQLPPLGLPRPARIVRGDETLCEPRLVAQCALPVTARGVVKLVATNYGLFEPIGDGFRLREIAPGLTLDEVRASVGCRLEVPDNVPLMRLA